MRYSEITLKMLKRLYILAMGSFLADKANGCKQVSVTKFANKNKITDLISEQDEVTMRFGVG